MPCWLRRKENPDRWRLAFDMHFTAGAERKCRRDGNLAAYLSRHPNPWPPRGTAPGHGGQPPRGLPLTGRTSRPRLPPRHARRRKDERVKRERLAASIVIARQNGADMPQFFF